MFIRLYHYFFMYFVGITTVGLATKILLYHITEKTPPARDAHAALGGQIQYPAAIIRDGEPRHNSIQAPAGVFDRFSAGNSPKKRLVM